jgi:hypothetical protein
MIVELRVHKGSGTSVNSRSYAAFDQVIGMRLSGFCVDSASVLNDDDSEIRNG